MSMQPQVVVVGTSTPLVVVVAVGTSTPLVVACAGAALTLFSFHLMARFPKTAGV